jgi:hypothetical protein
LRIVTHESITPRPINSYLWSKIASLSSKASYSKATKAPNIWKKFPATITTNQKSKNFILSIKPNSYQFFCQLVWPLNLDWLT